MHDLEERIKHLKKIVSENYRRAEFVQVDAEDPEDVALDAGMYWANYFGEDEELHYKEREIESLRDQSLAHDFSVQALCGTLLQYAKQGVSLVHGVPGNWPKGRPIGSQKLEEVLLQARNQAMHWEEGNFSSKVVCCFILLSQDFDASFAEYSTRNMAFDVVQLLQWKEFASFEKDMLSLD